uniref:Two component transcriptional regulator, Fis family n=1 Tax=Candidatus Kentrum sp. DK TaxID=2126562 RepID=A0A450SR40_9GAMM|nr:MAG: two component transcriptional regulator, Fis family [Candidatus Kentron sp. DK]
MKKMNLLLIDDDEGYNYVLSRALARRGFEVRGAHTPEEALDLAASESPHFVILDLNLNGHSGLNLIPPLRERCPDADILILTGYASIPTAVEAIKLGAREYLAKPASVESIVNALTAEVDATHHKPVDHFMSVQRMEWEYIQRVLAEHGGNITATARALKMHRRTLQRKLAKRPPAA